MDFVLLVSSGELVRSCSPGDVVTVSGVYLAVRVNQSLSLLYYYLMLIVFYVYDTAVIR